MPKAAELRWRVAGVTSGPPSAIIRAASWRRGPASLAAAHSAEPST